jgi:hypothetical protein
LINIKEKQIIDTGNFGKITHLRTSVWETRSGTLMLRISGVSPPLLRGA